jgi:ankyrin repeat protein
MSMSSKSTSIGSIRTSHPSQKDGSRQGILLSGRRIFYKVAGPLVKGERDFWKEIVDEGQLLPVPESRPKSPETNVFDRALDRALDRLCPGTLDPFDQSCSDCGYSIGWYHINGNYQDIDSFGNTKLHFAAAFGAPTLSVSFIRLAVDQGVDIAARNSSGQTFMHLLKTEQFLQRQGFANSLGYIALLKYLSELNFPFSQRDFHGRTIAHLICKDGILFSPEVKGNRAINKATQVLEILRILDTDMDALDNHGFKAGDEILKSAKNADRDMDNYHVVERAIQEFLETCRRPGLLQISFRQTLGQPDFSPVTWIKWLQEANLVDWIDIHGDTPLTALLKNLRNESDEAALGRMVSNIVQLGVDVNMRDRKGHTAIAIAAIRGSLPCVQALLNFGASVDIINYRGRDIVSMASLRMKMAKQQGKTQCYAKILACVNLIMDIQKEHGAVDKKWEDATVFWDGQIIGQKK